MAMEEPKDMSIPTLKSNLLDLTADHREQAGGYLYWLRAKLKAQGARNDLKKQREGFGPWVEDNLHITRKTADVWADDWAEENNLPTSRKTTKSGKGAGMGDDHGRIVDGPRIVYYNMTLKISEVEQEELIKAWEILGDAPATRLVYDTLVAAAKAAEPRPADTFTVDLGELNNVKKPAAPDRIKYAEEA